MPARRPPLPLLLFLALLAPCGAPAAAAGGDPPRQKADRDARPRLEIALSPTANLIHWVDNLAGSSSGKTITVYRRYWEERFGPHTSEDRQHLARFARVRSMVIQAAPRLANERGCLPIDEERMTWRQIFKSESMQSRSIEEFAQRLGPRLAAADREAVVACLRHFQPRFDRAFEQMGHARRFRPKLERFLKDGRLTGYLAEVAAFFDVDTASLPPMRISLMALPADGPTHAEADGDDLLIEIRPNDSPQEQIQVISHEATHFIMRRLGVDRIDRLASQSYGAGEAGALVWRYLWEGLPTALGQGVAEARLAPEIFSLFRPWYHIDEIDQFAHAIYPVVSKAMRERRPLEGEVMAALTREIQPTPIFQKARAAEFLMTSFYAAGDGFGPVVATMRAALGTSRDTGSAPGLQDGAVQSLLERYTCLGGVLLVRPTEIARAAALVGMPPLPEETLQRAGRITDAGHGFIIPGRRPGGGLLFMLVAPDVPVAEKVVEAFLARRGIPDRPQVVPTATDPASKP